VALVLQVVLYDLVDLVDLVVLLVLVALVVLEDLEVHLLLETLLVLEVLVVLEDLPKVPLALEILLDRVGRKVQHILDTHVHRVVPEDHKVLNILYHL
jgi:hypothetical protein